VFSDKAVLKPDEDDKIFMDRNPVVFGHVIDYLRSDRRELPIDISNDLKKQIEKEISYWKVYPDETLKEYKYLSLPL